jgi:hypothetical protein
MNSDDPKSLLRWLRGEVRASAEDSLAVDVDTLLGNYLAHHPLPPVDVEALAIQRGCRIESCSMPNRADGLLVPVDGGFILKVNSAGRTANNRRRRFTIAHEIAHTLFYEIPSHGIPKKIGGPLTYSQEEALCDLAAECMLVPAQLIRSSMLARVSRAHLGMVMAASAKFDVSTEVAARRLKKECAVFGGLGLCEWVAEDRYLRTRRYRFAASKHVRPFVLTWMVPPDANSDFAPPRGSRLPANSAIWELCSGRRKSVSQSEMRLGHKLLARLGEAVIVKSRWQPGQTDRVLATILDLKKIAHGGLRGTA